MFMNIIQYDTKLVDSYYLTQTILKVNLRKPCSFVYKSGQYIDLYFEDSKCRSFSIANSPSGDVIELHIQDSTGEMGLYFKEIEQSNRILKLSHPKGHCQCPDPILRPIVFIAGGCGFAPVKAMLECITKSEQSNHPISLYWGGMEKEDLYYHQQLCLWAKTYDWFNYIPVLESLSDIKDKNIYRTGNVVDCVLRDFPFFRMKDVFIFGSAAMVSYFVTLSQDRIEHEYFHSDFTSNKKMEAMA